MMRKTTINSTKNCPNQNCYLNLYCSEQTIERLHKGLLFFNHGKDQSIFLEGNPVQGIFIIYSGKVKVCIKGVDDSLQIVRFAKSGNILGHRGFGVTTYPVSAYAMEDTTVCFLDNKFFEEVLLENPKLTFHLMLFCLDELRKSENRISNLSQKFVQGRIADALLELEEVFGYVPGKEGVLNMKLSRTDLANIAGAAYETTIRILVHFEEQKLIALSRKQLKILDRVNLKRLSKENLQ